MSASLFENGTRHTANGPEGESPRVPDAVSPVPSEEREIGRAILGALDMYWSQRDDTTAGIAADKLIVKTLTPFGAWAATLAIEKHRAAAPRHHREPDCAALAEMARALGRPPQQDHRTYGWSAPRENPEHEARAARIREWAAGLTDEQHERLRARATRRTLRGWAEKDLRATTLGRAALVLAAQLTEPELLPLMLREDIDTIEKNKARRTA
jgi:hypothetical protein